MSEKTYEDGVQEGKIASMEAILHDHRGRLDNHATRLRLLEKAVWVFFGAVVLIQTAPKLKEFFGFI